MLLTLELYNRQHHCVSVDSWKIPGPLRQIVLWFHNSMKCNDLIWDIWISAGIIFICTFVCRSEYFLLAYSLENRKQECWLHVLLMLSGTNCILPQQCEGHHSLLFQTIAANHLLFSTITSVMNFLLLSFLLFFFLCFPFSKPLSMTAMWRVSRALQRFNLTDEQQEEVKQNIRWKTNNKGERERLTQREQDNPKPAWILAQIDFHRYLSDTFESMNPSRDPLHVNTQLDS